MRAETQHGPAFHRGAPLTLIPWVVLGLLTGAGSVEAAAISSAASGDWDTSGTWSLA